jgi:molybdenum ABC transporter molybdate-binding protein
MRLTRRSLPGRKSRPNYCWVQYGFFLGLLVLSHGVKSAEATIAVAANFRETAEAIAERLESTSPHRFTIISGSTGKLISQALHGAPFDVLMAADQARPLRLITEGLAEPTARRTYALGELGLWWPDKVPPFGVLELSELSPHSVCVANPALAPYGAAAWSLLAQSGLPEDWLAGVARVDNVHLVAAMVAQRHARAGFIARASVAAMVRKGDITVDEQSILWLVPKTPIRQDLVLLKRAEGNAAAKWWVTQLFEASVQRLLVSHGYRLPNEESLR